MKTKKLTHALLSVIVFLPCISSAVLLPADDRRPNILFIMVDDQSPFDLQVYDKNSKLATPNIDQLAARGMVFDAAPSDGCLDRGRLHLFATYDHGRSPAVARAQQAWTNQ